VSLSLQLTFEYTLYVALYGSLTPIISMLVFKSKRMRTGLSSKKETDGSRPFVDIVGFKYFFTSQKITNSGSLILHLIGLPRSRKKGAKKVNLHCCEVTNRALDKRGLLQFPF